MINFLWPAPNAEEVPECLSEAGDPSVMGCSMTHSCHHTASGSHRATVARCTFVLFFFQSWWTSFPLTGQRLRALCPLQVATAAEQAAWQGAVGGFESPTVTSMTLGYIGCLSQSQKAKKLEEKKGIMRRREFLWVTVGGPTAVY